jgi:hypothetical protein
VSTTLEQIQRAVRSGNYELTIKARLDMDVDDLDPQGVIESILNATQVFKTIRSTSKDRRKRREYLHIIISPDSSGVLIYTKGKLEARASKVTYYIFVSAKHAE